MKMERLMVLLEDWAVFMKHDNTKLGYPSKSLGMSTGGESSEAFDDMIGVADNKNVITLNAIVHSLPKEQRDAIYARWLNSNKPMYYEFKLGLAMDNLLIMAGRRIYA
tara:strand:+ start:406 stop:729 length:324 start_codon:yes stop_codon:yes gene_type:complete